MKRVLNLYAGLGGNRKLWGNILGTQGPGVHVTAVEYSGEIAAIYKHLYPQDTVVVGDAHRYLLNHFKEFDFIWASPPCQTHSSFRQNICVKYRNTPPVYPDMRLWQEIVFLQANCEAKWVVENVKPYYQPLIPPTTMLERHCFWANFSITDRVFTSVKIRTAQIPDLQRYHGLDLSSYNIANKRQILRNCVHYDLGDHIYRCAEKQHLGEVITRVTSTPNFGSGITADTPDNLYVKMRLREYGEAAAISNFRCHTNIVCDL